MPRIREDLHRAICKLESCQKEFFQKKPGQEYCSQACSNKASPGIGGRKPTTGLESRTCANPECRRIFQPYRDNQVTCSRACYKQLPSIKERENARRRTPEHREKKNKWRRETPAQVERVRTYNREQQLARRGMTPADFDAMLEAQGSGCMICGSTPNPEGVRAESKLHVDHDHETGATRDLLCSNCNKGLGCFGDDPERLRVAADYIERHRLAVVT
jgi:hypothetical protein